MENPIFGILLLVFVIGPLVIFLHEVGHAIHALFVTRRPIHIHLGRRVPQHVYRIGRVVLHIGWTWNPLIMTSGRTTWPRDGIGHWGHVWVLMGGPSSSWHQMLLYNYLAFRWQSSDIGWLMQLAALMAFCSLLVTIIPMRFPAWLGEYAGQQNDASRAVDHLRALRAERLREG